MKRDTPMEHRAFAVLTALAALTFGLTGCGGGGGGSHPSTASVYKQANLVADQAGVAAQTDPNLVNAWGIAFSPTGPFWIANNHSGTSTLYDGSGALQPLVVTLPAAPGIAGPGSPTGTVFNSTSDFVIGGSGPSVFIFASEDGTLSAWNAASGKAGVIVADRSALGAVYKGLAIAATASGNFLYATNFHAGVVDQFDAGFHLVGSFTDTSMPAGFAPFGIQNIGGSLYITFAKQLAPDNHDDQSGPGNGFVDVFTPAGVLIKRLVSHGPLNSPWGLALAPVGFGQFSSALLVSNFGDGHISAFNPTTGNFLGQIQDASGKPVLIDGLWGLTFGNGGKAGPATTLFFTAGPGAESHGLFGTLTLQ